MAIEALSTTLDSHILQPRYSVDERYESLDPRRYNLSPDVRVLHVQDKKLLICDAPIAPLDRGGVVVDQEVLDTISQQMESETENRQFGGQNTPILVAQVMDQIREDLPSLFLCDGFHRSTLLERGGFHRIYATIKLGCTLTDAMDMRIANATNHTTISFARLVEWANTSWELTPWSKKGIPIGSAFGLVAGQSITGARMNVPKEELEEIRTWVRARAELWKRSPASIYQSLLISHKASPNLVHITRAGRVGPGEISQKNLGLIANAAPFDYALQDKIADTIMGDQYETWEVETIVECIRTAQPKEVDRLLAGGWRTRRDTPPRTTITQAPKYKVIEEPQKREPERPVSNTPPAVILSEARTVRELKSTVSEELLDRMWDLLLTNTQLTVENAFLLSGIRTQQEIMHDERNHPQEAIQRSGDGEVVLAVKQNDITQFDIAAIVTDAKRGQMQAYDAYYEQYMQAKLEYYFAMRMAENGAYTAEDLAQDVYIKTKESLLDNKYNPEIFNLQAWMYRIASNLLIDKFRRYRETAQLDEAWMVEDNTGQSDSIDPIAAKRVHHAILLLTEDQRTAVMLRYFSGYDLDNGQVAEIMGKNEGAIKALLHRAKDAILRVSSD